MNERQFSRMRLRITAAFTFSIWALLGWWHFHGGVPSHHIAARADMPAISNWWSGLLLPALTWFLLGRVDKRMVLRGHPDRYSKDVVAGFICAAAFGILLSLFFVMHAESATSNMVMSLPVLALLFPIHRAEYYLGFVIGMTTTFGTVLPAGFGMLVALMAAAVHLGVRPLLLLAASRLVRRRAR